MSSTVASEIITTGYVGGEKLRLQMLRATRGVFSFAAVALIAIAATIGATYWAHEKTNDSISESREISRLATGTLSAAVERELELFTDRAISGRSAAVAASKAAVQVQMMIDSLVNAARNDRDRTTEIAGIRSAQRDWVASLRDVTGDADLASESLQSIRFENLRERLINFVTWENERYADRQAEQRTQRYLMNGAVFAEMLLLLLVVVEDC